MTRPTVESDVVPGVTLDKGPLGTWSLRHDVLEHSKHALRRPAQSQWDMPGVHAQIIEHPRLATELILTLPTHRFRSIEVAGVEEAVPRFHNRA